MNLIEHLVFYTFLMQGFLFPILIVAVTIYIGKGLTKKAKFRNLKKGKRTLAQKKDDGLPALKPLLCGKCGGSIPLRENYTHCQYCEAPVEIPKDYLIVAGMRRDIAARLNKAESYWRRAKFFTSPGLKWFLRLVYLWLIFTIIILIKNDGEPLQETLFEKVKSVFGGAGEWLEAVSLLTVPCWIILIMTTIWAIGTKSRKFLPTAQTPINLKKNKKASCSSCGAGIEFEGNNLATLCNYCGVETYRVKFANRLKNEESNKRIESTFSLIEAMDAYDEALEDILSMPSMLILIFIILPFFMIVLPKMLYDYFSENLIPLLVLIGVTVGFILFFIFRKKKLPEVKDNFTGPTSS